MPTTVFRNAAEGQARGMVVVEILARAAEFCLMAVGVVWLATAVWFAAVRPATLRGKAAHFCRTLMPEPWMLFGLAILVVVANLLPRSVRDETRWHSAGLVAVGAVLVIVSAVFMIWARFALGAMWAGRPMIQQDHSLRTGGPYRLVRHPIYTGLIGLMAGATLMAGFGVTTLQLLFVVAWLLHRVRVEDRMLITTFGDRYRDYRRRVLALVPLPGHRADA